MPALEFCCEGVNNQYGLSRNGLSMPPINHQHTLHHHNAKRNYFQTHRHHETEVRVTSRKSLTAKTVKHWHRSFNGLLQYLPTSKK